MDIEAQILKNAENIATLTQTTTELSTVMKYEIERAKDDRTSVKEMVNELKALNNKITEMAGVQKEQQAAANAITELRAGYSQLKEWKDKFDLSKMDSRIGVLESHDAKEKAVKETVTTGLDWFWRLFGNAITAGITVLIFWLCTQNTASTTTIMEKSIHGVITGE